MSWFKRKTQEEKLLDKQKEVDKLNNKWVKELNTYCKMDNNIFILLGFEIWKNKVCVRYRDSTCVEGYDGMREEFWFGHRDFGKARRDFIQFKNDLNKIGLELKKI
jgi:hypothetical protein